ncbi:hypothetical protein CIB95_13880 [Lottiidibacillus patelloidae]|uniref:Uncharacterized protein n=1 Tax=Lottiidibacillus patelloidae TaxID=2670334 RepID=A0A263BSM4_9BACI|nr:hypothetical protein [Lottiidibacillus patelloidae]OZM56186.1 hypothetical protein CIB95_13880 [Lottiidibacillus patelloidae]
MFEDKRLEKKLLHLKQEYNNIDTTSDSEKILYHILNERDQPKKKPVKKYPFTYIASLAAVLLIGVFVGLSSLLGQGGSKSNEVNESLALDASPESAGEESYDGHSSGGTNDEQEESDGADQDKGMSKEEFIKKQEEEQTKYEEENKAFYEVFQDQLNSLYDKASNYLSMPKDKLHDIYSMDVAKQIIVENYRHSQEENKFEITKEKLNSFIGNTKYIYGNDVFGKMEYEILDIYDAYKDSGYDDEVLRGLEPFQVMALWLYTSVNGDDDMQWHLLVKTGNHHYPSRETYLEESTPPSEEMKQQRRDFIESIYMMEQIVFTAESNIRDNEETDTADIIMHRSENFADRESMIGFALTKNDKGIWKVNFMPMQ